MPFTPSHVAAVLPLHRRLAASALVVGSMVPDLPYYLPVHPPAGPGADVTHSPTGVVTLDVLLGLAVFLLWHGLLAGPALAASPAGLRARVPRAALAGVRERLATPVRVVRVLVSLSVGAATHVLWDSFTHDGRWGVRHVDWLAQPHASVAGYTWAQLASSVAGLLLVAIWTRRWWVSATVREPGPPGLPGPLAAAARTGVVGAGLIAAAAAGVGPLTAPDGPRLYHAAFDAATAGVAAGGAAAVVLAVVVTTARSRAGAR